MKRPRAKLFGINLIVIALVLSSLQQMSVLINSKDWYFETLAAMPHWLIMLRYVFSITQRIIGISCAVGLLLYKELFRKITMVLGVFTMLTLYWKHPYSGFVKIFESVKPQIAEQLEVLSQQAPSITFESIILMAVVCVYLLDILFWLVVIFYLRKSKVKEQFH